MTRAPIPVLPNLLGFVPQFIFMAIFKLLYERRKQAKDTRVSRNTPLAWFQYGCAGFRPSHRDRAHTQMPKLMYTR